MSPLLTPCNVVSGNNSGHRGHRSSELTQHLIRTLSRLYNDNASNIRELYNKTHAQDAGNNSIHYLRNRLNLERFSIMQWQIQVNWFKLHSKFHWSATVSSQHGLKIEPLRVQPLLFFAPNFCMGLSVHSKNIAQSCLFPSDLCFVCTCNSCKE